MKMINMKKEKTKRNIFLTISIISAFIFAAGLVSTIMGDDSPVKFIVNDKPIILIVLPALVFFVTFFLYRNSKKLIEEKIK